MMMSLLSIPISAPVLSWLDLSKLIHYMGKWIEFQVSKLRKFSRCQTLFKPLNNPINRSNTHDKSYEKG
jgi:hypothetical protein